jgi:hypothetical protein
MILPRAAKQHACRETQNVEILRPANTADLKRTEGL